MLEALTVNQLGFVTPKNDKHRLDMLLQAGRNPAASSTPGVFETLCACAIEDERRARALIKLKASVLKSISGADAATLSGLLEIFAAHVRHHADPCWLMERSSKPAFQLPRPSLASATYMRDRRLGILGAILDLIADSANLEVAWITATDPSFCFDQKRNWSEIVATARERFLQELERSGAMAAPGFMLTYLTGYRDPRINEFRMEFRGIAGGQKLRLGDHNAVNGRAQRPKPYRSLSCRRYEIRDLPRQIAGMMPNFLVELVTSSRGKVTGTRRMSEPHHSIYLMWLDQYSLADMWVVSGASYLRGRFALDRLHEDVAAQAM